MLWFLKFVDVLYLVCVVVLVFVVMVGVVMGVVVECECV